MRSYLLPVLLLIVDVITIIGVALISLLIRFDGYITPQYMEQMIAALPIMVISYIIMLLSMHLYTRIWRYAGMREVVAVLIATTLGAGLFYTGMHVFDKSLPRSIYLISWLLSTGVIGIGRMVLHYIAMRYGGKPSADAEMVNTLIIGAGDAGATIAREIERYHKRSRKVIGFIDDDESKFNRLMGGIRILGNRNDIPTIVKEYRVKEIIIAMPSVKRDEIRGIMEICSPLKCKVNTLPGMYQLLDDEVLVSHLHPVSIEDLLERDEVRLDMDIVEHYIHDKVVLVTGAGGSIGSEICRQVSSFRPKELIILGHGENSIYQLNMELLGKYAEHFRITPVIADVQDRKRIFEVMEKYRPDVVYHAAAHKHVPLMEINPREAVKNNILGTRNVAEAANHAKVKTFVMISTDKAVNPPNIMGATKRLCEMIVQDMATKSDSTKYVAVRFGNVLGSRGSVIPLFKKQIAKGGPITVTHPDIVRYFMTIPEAAQLVIQAGSLARGGEIFVLDMGKPVRIVDLAKNLIRLSGYSEDDIEIKFTGLRPGEKMYEELLNEGEINPKQIFPKIHIGIADNSKIDRVYDFIEKFEDYSEQELHDELIDIANKKK